MAVVRTSKKESGRVALLGLPHVLVGLPAGLPCVCRTPTSVGAGLLTLLGQGPAFGGRLLIAAYQTFARGLFPPACRFYPSCSDYALWTLKTYNLPTALRLSAKRLLICHPFFKP